jgi:hypothetical protein
MKLNEEVQLNKLAAYGTTEGAEKGWQTRGKSGDGEDATPSRDEWGNPTKLKYATPGDPRVKEANEKALKDMKIDPTKPWSQEKQKLSKSKRVALIRQRSANRVLNDDGSVRPFAG